MYAPICDSRPYRKQNPGGVRGGGKLEIRIRRRLVMQPRYFLKKNSFCSYDNKHHMPFDSRPLTLELARGAQALQGPQAPLKRASRAQLLCAGYLAPKVAR